MAQYKRALDLDPTFVEARLHMANAYLDQGRFKDFYAELDGWQRIAPDTRIEPMRAFGMAVEGRKAEALELLHKCEHPGTGAFVQASYIANVYAVLGDKEQMYMWLDKAYAARDGMLVYASKQGCYRRYRQEPRFIALEQKLGLPVAQ